MSVCALINYLDPLTIDRCKPEDDFVEPIGRKGADGTK